MQQYRRSPDNDLLSFTVGVRFSSSFPLTWDRREGLGAGSGTLGTLKALNCQEKQVSNAFIVLTLSERLNSQSLAQFKMCIIVALYCHCHKVMRSVFTRNTLKQRGKKVLHLYCCCSHPEPSRPDYRVDLQTCWQVETKHIQPIPRSAERQMPFSLIKLGRLMTQSSSSLLPKYPPDSLQM